MRYIIDLQQFKVIDKCYSHVTFLSQIADFVTNYPHSLRSRFVGGELYHPKISAQEPSSS